MTPPFYATELRMAILAHTDVGLRIDPEARVIGESSSADPRAVRGGRVHRQRHRQYLRGERELLRQLRRVRADRGEERCSRG